MGKTLWALHVLICFWFRLKIRVQWKQSQNGALQYKTMFKHKVKYRTSQASLWKKHVYFNQLFGHNNVGKFISRRGNVGNDWRFVNLSVVKLSSMYRNAKDWLFFLLLQTCICCFFLIHSVTVNHWTFLCFHPP